LLENKFVSFAVENDSNPKFMKKNLLPILILLMLVPELQAITHKVIPAKNDEVLTLKNSTLMVVLLEENKKYTDKLNKMHKAALVTAYQNEISSINSNMQTMADKYLKVAKGIEYKTMSEVIAMPLAKREEYSFLVYDRSTQFAGGAPSDFTFDFYADKDDELNGMLDDYKDYIQFDCADPKYHGEEDYRRIDILVKGKKKAADIIFMQGLDMVIPTKGSLALCFMAIQSQFNTALAGDKKADKEEEKQNAAKQVAKVKAKTLLICKDNLDKTTTEAKISAAYPNRFKIVSREEFDNSILNNDTCCCLLVVYPASKTMGGYRPTVGWQHLVVDAETGDVLLTVSPEVANANVPPGYAKVTDKNIKDIGKAEDDAAK
jgi:hypothetical protein